MPYYNNKNRDINLVTGSPMQIAFTVVIMIAAIPLGVAMITIITLMNFIVEHFLLASVIYNGTALLTSFILALLKKGEKARKVLSLIHI